MKGLLSYGLVLVALFSLNACKHGDNGELVGASAKGKWFEPVPDGMSFIKQGSLIIGSNDQDVFSAGNTAREVSVQPFWMDDTEITNSEYRQFTNWVRDSIALTLTFPVTDEYKLVDKEGKPSETAVINWKKRHYVWEDDDEAVRNALEAMYVPEKERFFKKKEIDSRKLFYEYSWIDFKQAARRANSYNYEKQRYEGSVNRDGKDIPIADRSAFIMRDKVQVYPDTLVWIRDFTYAFNEPWTSRYYWHPGFDDYPVVGVTWKQAKAFCSWRTNVKNKALSKKGQYEVQDYRLPTEVEWEYAARGGQKVSSYPWGGYYTRNSKGEFLANFKPLRGNYSVDGGMGPMKVGSYDPNGFGLYDMAGNVAEWTITAYDPSAYTYIHDFNPNYEYNALAGDPPAMKRKVIRGGSWKDISYFLKVGTRSYEYQDSAKSYIGFRCVRSSFGNQKR
ncbi:MAG: SUMF1/EgtB/PvdO family nonheme iron enzyme [Bacteroidota bacterium]|nr:SUMF1/EgtB/PvdO family nonheme iron enzyme [Bacteroidota bacterium]MDP4205134.1 SUMF1/EgtB/PvdO family nonheme iron enzyme [Bacteroidota bacterium]